MLISTNMYTSKNIFIVQSMIFKKEITILSSNLYSRCINTYVFSKSYPLVQNGSILNRLRYYSTLHKDESEKGSKKTLIASMILFSLTGVGLYLYFLRVKEQTEKKKFEMASKIVGSYGQAKVGGPFSLINHLNEPVTQESFYGKYLLLYFGFTNCPDICPDELDKLTEVITALDKQTETKDNIIPIFITVDPKRDKSEQVAAYIKDFHPKLVGLTGSSDDIKSICKAYRVYYSQNALTEGVDDYLVDHSVFFYFVGPDGKFIEFFGRDLNASEIASKISEYITKT